MEETKEKNVPYKYQYVPAVPRHILDAFTNLLTNDVSKLHRSSLCILKYVNELKSDCSLKPDLKVSK